MTATVNSRLRLGLKTHLKHVKSSVANIADDIAQGFFEITHNSFALLGLALVFAVITLTARADLRQAGENKLMAWLQERREATIGFTEPDAIDRATAANPKDLPKQQDRSFGRKSRI